MCKFLFFLALLFSFFTAFSQSTLNVDLTATNAVLMNAKTGHILYEKEGFTPTFPASTTKIATALYALHVMGDDLDKIFTVKREAIASITPQAKKDSHYRSPPHWLETDGVHIGLRAGEESSFYHLLHALLISSANDAANVIALNIEPTIARFMEKVNDYLLAIGCKMTFFNNPHGLHHPAHMTTAYDLACMTKEAIQYPVFREIVQKTKYLFPATNLEVERTLIQTNLLLRKGAFHYANALGVKTGITQAAGKNLVAAASEGGRELIAVVLGCKTRNQVYQDARKLFDAAFHEPKKRRILFPPGDRSFSLKIKGGARTLQAVLPEGLAYDFYPAEDEPYKIIRKWELPKLPIKSGSVIGRLEVTNERGELLATSALIAASDVRRTSWPYIAAAFAIFLLLFVIFRRVTS